MNYITAILSKCKVKLLSIYNLHLHNTFANYPMNWLGAIVGFEVGNEGISGLGGKANGRRVLIRFRVVMVVVVVVARVLAVTVVVAM